MYHWEQASLCVIPVLKKCIQLHLIMSPSSKGKGVCAGGGGGGWGGGGGVGGAVHIVFGADPVGG